MGQPFGQTYEIQKNGSLKVLSHEVVSTIEVVQEETRDNRFVEDIEGTQVITSDDIKELQSQFSLTGRDLVDKIISGNSNYASKTEFAQEKYRRAKEAKHLPIFTPLAPTIWNIHDFLFRKDPSKIMYMDNTAMSQLLLEADISPGRNYIVVDDTGGLLVGAILSRLKGSGSVVNIQTKASYDLHLLNHFTDLPPVEELFESGKLCTLNFLQAFVQVDTPHTETKNLNMSQFPQKMAEKGAHRLKGQNVRLKMQRHGLELLRSRSFAG